MPKPLHERLKLAEATTSADKKSGRMVIQVMTPGWGSSGYYSPQVCEAAAALMPAGTQMFLDHQHQDGSGLDERGNRSLRDLAAVFTSAATWDATAQATVAECQVTAPYREFLADDDVAPHIGLSLNGAASDIKIGEAEGRSGPIIESIAAVDSVDFVSRAGRGGKVVALLESARFIAEATADDRAQQLTDAVRAAHTGQGTWAYVLDQDAEKKVVWFRVSGDMGPAHSYEQTYEIAANDAAVTLIGDPIEVSRMTTYVPVTRPDNTTTESEEDTMPKIQIEESEHTRLTETAGRVDVLESENATLKAENTTLKEAAVAGTCAARARAVIEASELKFTPLEARALLVDLPVKEAAVDGVTTQALDEDAFTERLTEAAKESAATLTAKGGLVGFGASADDGTTVSESKPTTNAWGRPLAESKGA